MKAGKIALLLLMALAVSVAARADQIILKNGRVYSGKFIRGDSDSLEFRILGRVENFKTSEVDRIVFENPELATRPAEPSPAPERAPSAAPVVPSGSAAGQTASAPPADTAGRVTLPAGTPLVVRTLTAIDTDNNRVGDIFEATLEDPLVSDGVTLAPRGSLVQGVIAYAEESGKLSGQSTLILELTELDADGRTYHLRTSDYSEVGASRGKDTAKKVGGGAALGAIIGAIAGGGKGAAVGAATGAAVGTGVQVMTRGETLKVPAETILEFRLQHPLEIAKP